MEQEHLELFKETKITKIFESILIFISCQLIINILYVFFFILKTFVDLDIWIKIFESTKWNWI